MHNFIISGLANSRRARRAVTVVLLVVSLIGLGELASAAKPDKPRGQTENAPASATILATNGLVHDGVNEYVDYRVETSTDCLVFLVPSRDGVDGGRATLFHYGPDFGECYDFPGRVLRSFGVSNTAYDLNDDGDGSPGLESLLRGQFRCFDVFTSDTSDAYCWFRIYGSSDGTISWRVDWPSVIVEVIDGSNGDVRRVTNVGDATIYRAVQTVNGNSRKLKTELQLQGAESILLDIQFERLSY